MKLKSTGTSRMERDNQLRLSSYLLQQIPRIVLLKSIYSVVYRICLDDMEMMVFQGGMWLG